MSSKKSKERAVEEQVSPTPAERELTRQTTLVSGKKVEIETQAEELKKSLANADKELVLKEKIIEARITETNEVINSMRGEATAAVASIETGVRNSSEKIDEAFADMRTTANAIPLLVIVAYYVVYVYEYGLTYNPVVFGGFAIAAIVAVVFKVILDRVYFNLSVTRNQATKTIKETNRGLGGFLTTKLGIEPNLTRMKNNFANAIGYGQVVISTMRDYFPALEGVYDSKERMNMQLAFIRSLRNALTTYGFDLSSKANEYLSHFGPLSNSEDEWIDEATGKLTSILGTSQPLLKMMYFDYVGNNEPLKNTWKEIVTKPKLLTELSRLLISNNLVETEYIQKNVETYGAIEDLIKEEKQFNFEAFRERYTTYYIDMAREKKALLDGLRDYRLTVSQSFAEQVLKFPPPSFEVEKRHESLFSFVSEQTGLHADVVKLAYYEREGDVLKRGQAWNDLRRDGKQVSEFVTRLIDNRAIEVPTQYLADRSSLSDFGVSVLAGFDDFTLAAAKRSLQLTFTFLEAQKDTFLRLMSSKIILSEADRKAFAKWLTPKANPGTIAKWIQDHTGVPDYVLLLLYYDYIQDTKERIRQYDSMREPKKMQELSATLIERNFVPTSENVDAKAAILNLSLLLMRLEDYDRADIQLKFATYNQLLSYSKDLLALLKEQEFVGEKASSDFESVLNSVKLDISEPIKQELAILDELIASQAGKEFNSKEWHQPITTATLAFYLWTHENLLSQAACKAAGANDKASKILYQYSRVNDEEEQRGATNRTKFAEIVRKTIDGTYTNYEYLIPFKDELTSGFLFTRISHLLHARLDIIEARIVDKARFEQIIKRYSDATNTFLDSKIQASVILESLRMQLISAYMITKLGAADVMTGIVDEELPKACEELTKDDPIYRNFLLLSEETIGPGTRIGIVPFQMDFTTFSEHFEKAFHLSVAKHREIGSTHQLSEFSGNLVRFFPSDAYFKRVEGKAQASGKLPDDHPAEIIRKLVLKYYGAVENLELIASMTGQFENPIALKSLLTTFFDTDTTIYLMAQKQLDVLLGNSQFLEYIKSNRLDKGLYASFNCSTRTALAKAMSDLSGHAGINASVVKQRLTSEIGKMAKQSGARLDDDQVKGVSSVVYQVLLDIGTVLQGFPQRE